MREEQPSVAWFDWCGRAVLGIPVPFAVGGLRQTLCLSCDFLHTTFSGCMPCSATCAAPLWGLAPC